MQMLENIESKFMHYIVSKSKVSKT